MQSIIIVGLGNPGKKFENTKHNAGFMALDAFAKKNNFPEFTESKKYQSEISEKDDVLLVKPQTFMNDSGHAVKKLTTNYSLTTTHLLVVHDEIDLPLGKMKFSKDSGAGGHKGVDSIIASLGTKDFARLKIGIANGSHEAIEVVLEKFSPQEQEILNGVIEKSVQALEYFTNNGLEKTMNEYNR